MSIDKQIFIALESDGASFGSPAAAFIFFQQQLTYIFFVSLISPSSAKWSVQWSAFKNKHDNLMDTKIILIIFALIAFF